MLIVEDGTGVANANTYASVLFADDYHTAYGNLDWAGDNTTKEQALVIACLSLDLLYGPKYVSTRLDAEQALLWPRYPFYDRNGNVRVSTSVPVEVKRAQCELALMYLMGVDMFPEGNASATIESESVKVGEIATSTTYSKAGKTEISTYEGFRKVDLLLWNVIKGRKGLIYLVR